MFFNFAKSEEQITFLNVFNNKGHPKVICTSLKNHPQDLHCNSFRQSHKLIAVLQTPLQIYQEPFGPKYKEALQVCQVKCLDQVHTPNHSVLPDSKVNNHA